MEQEYYNWNFAQAPLNRGEDHCCVAVDSQGIVLGVMGLNERTFIFRNEKLAAAELTTWIVAPKGQNKGIGPAMLRYLQKRYDVLLGMGITPMAVSIYLRHGFRYLNPVPRYMKVFDLNKVENLAYTDKRTSKIHRYWRQNSVTSQVPYKTIEATDDIIEEVNSTFSSRANCFARGATEMAWRYSRHPTYSYNVKIITNPNESGSLAVLVYRLQDINDGVRIAHILDLFGDLPAMKSAVSFVETELPKLGVDFIDFYSTYGEHQGLFLSCGWFMLGSDSFFNFPHLFNPVELRNPSSNSFVLWGRDGAESLFNFSSCYISKQDCDFDRP
ncbi:GNAT family N-acetyltransferase [Pseudovibrio axinellae]|nr:GNAT family N-acetyltransferase [Pseudovibrio axinellae]